MHYVVWQKLTDVLEVLTASIMRGMESVNTSEMLVSIYQATQSNIWEDSYAHSHHCENQKSHEETWSSWNGTK
jgi:hypothetical protein